MRVEGDSGRWAGVRFGLGQGFEDDAGQGKRAGVSERERNMSDTEPRGALSGATVEAKRGVRAGCAPDLNFQPCDAAADAGSESLGAGFFGGEAGGKTFGGFFALAQAVSLLFGGEDATEKTAAEALDGIADATNLCRVNTCADNHAGLQANTGMRDFSSAWKCVHE